MSFNPEYSEQPPSAEEIESLTGQVLLEFGAPWCGYCQAAGPLVEEAMRDFPALTHIKVYDGKGRRLGRVFRVKLWPTLIVLKDGKELDRLVRPNTAAEITDLLQSIR